jgi:hypothetical protein
MIAPRRPVGTYIHYGREVYRDTGRPVEEDLGSHVVLRIVEDPEAFAAAIEADGDGELDRWPARQRAIAEHRRNQRYQTSEACGE